MGSSGEEETKGSNLFFFPRKRKERGKKERCRSWGGEASDFLGGKFPLIRGKGTRGSHAEGKWGYKAARGEERRETSSLGRGGKGGEILSLVSKEGAPRVLIRGKEEGRAIPQALFGGGGKRKRKTLTRQKSMVASGKGEKSDDSSERKGRGRKKFLKGGEEKKKGEEEKNQSFLWKEDGMHFSH